ncbi:hypothetical protein ACERK3_17635 [Phycisphaerales bacterium AB-hyl4]|uniref:Uncharacterized protein n=1 Tax=Natronomicrosphaera hydrolytica TaxID=3242702 RepID=A0ABV4UBK3_9BACT
MAMHFAAVHGTARLTFRRSSGMRLDSCSNPSPLPPRGGEPCAVSSQRPAHHISEAATARVVPGALAEQGALPLADEGREPGPSGKWPWQLPLTCDQPPPPEPKVWSVPYPSPAEARTGSMLDLLA